MPQPNRLTRRDTRRSRGFSLLELMLVVVIMGILMSVVIVNLAGAGEKAKREATIVKMKQIKSALAVYSTDFGSMPPTELGLQPLVSTKALDKVPYDGWKRPLRYMYPGTSPNTTDEPFDLMSAGADGQWNTVDDINIWVIERAESVPNAINP
ncbi:MAG TPA: type II secretion system protein GspG [Phycisphaerales bacterium]|nr:type II secretion system protein GspG [Phycisphaerales bacterium]